MSHKGPKGFEKSLREYYNELEYALRTLQNEIVYINYSPHQLFWHTFLENNST